MQRDIESITKHLSESKTSIDKLQAPHEPGVYAYFLEDSSALSPFVPGHDGLIYVGSTSDLAIRKFENHFNSKSTGFSTLRRSIGAILKKSLRLTATPRSSGKSKTNIQNYKFQADGEDRLTDWMRRTLRVSVCPVNEPNSVETVLIKTLRPLLNLKGWANPDGTKIRALRKICADEARANIGRS